MPRTRIKCPKRNTATATDPNKDTDIQYQCLCAACHLDLSTDFSIECDLCGSWFHGKCVSLAKKDFDVIVNLGNAVKWLCNKCSSLDTKISADVEVSDVDTSLSNRLETLEKSVSLLVSTISQSKVDSPIPTTFKSFSEALRRGVNKSGATPSNTGSSPANKPNGVSKNGQTIIVKGIKDRSACPNVASIRAKLNSVFPKLKILGAHFSPKGLLFINLLTQDDADRLLNGWNSTIFGPNTSTVKYDPSFRKSNYVIIKNAPGELLEAEMLNDLQKQFDSCNEVVRFRRQGQPLNIIKVGFSNAAHASQSLEKGVYLSTCWFLPEMYRETRFPIRCFKCCRYGHTSQFCKNNLTCSKCSENHIYRDCQSEVSRCCNCGGDHSAMDRNCPVFLNLLKKSNFLE